MDSEPMASPRTSAIPRYARVEVIGGMVMVFIAGLIWYGAIGLSVGEIVNFGPGAMPKALAIVLFIAGGSVLLHGLFQRREEAEPVALALRPPLILALAIVLFALFIRGGEFWFVSTPRFGLTVVGPLTVIIAGFATREADPKELIVMGFGLTAAALLVFSDLLGVPIPVLPKVIEDAIPPSLGADNAVRVVYAAYGGIAAFLYFAFFGRPEPGRG